MVSVVDDLALPPTLLSLPAGPDIGSLCANLVDETVARLRRLAVAYTVEERPFRRDREKDEAHRGAGVLVFPPFLSRGGGCGAGCEVFLGDGVSMTIAQV